MIMTIDRSFARTFHEEVNVALLAVAKKHGMHYRPGGFSYNPAEIGGRVKFVLEGKQADVEHKHDARFEQLFNLKVNEVYLLGTKKYRLHGFTSRGSALIMDENQKRFRCHPTLLKTEQGDKPAMKNAYDCYACKGTKCVTEIGHRRAGPELIIITTKCMKCGDIQKEPID